MLAGHVKGTMTSRTPLLRLSASAEARTAAVASAEVDPMARRRQNSRAP
jgi:hypothetical protein